MASSPRKISGVPAGFVVEIRREHGARWQRLWATFRVRKPEAIAAFHAAGETSGKFSELRANRLARIRPLYVDAADHFER